MKCKVGQSFTDRQTEETIRSKITLILFCCSILVIYIHAFNLETYQISSDSLGVAKLTFGIETIVATVNKFAVPIFFMISGFLFCRTLSEKLIFKKMLNRAKTVLLPYLIWCTLYYLFFAVLAMIPFVRAAMNSANTEGISFVGWLKSLWVDEYYTLWFLKNLLLFILISPLIFVVLKNHKKLHNGTVVIIAVMVISLLGYGKIELFSGLTEYLLGCYIGLNYKEIVTWKAPKACTYAPWAWVALVVLLIISYFSFNVIVEALFLVLVWIGLDVFQTIQVHWWMKITFFTYVCHDFLLEAIEKIVFIFLPQVPVIALLDYLLVPVLVEIVLIGMAYFMIKKTPLLWNVLTGWRKSDLILNNVQGK